MEVTLVRPEVSADRAVGTGGVFRHSVRFLRIRQNMAAPDVACFGPEPPLARWSTSPRTGVTSLVTSACDNGACHTL